MTKQQVYDRYMEASEALNRAEMAGDDEQIAAAGKAWTKAWEDKYMMDHYGTTEIEPLF